MTKTIARIIGTGSYLPQTILSNQDLEKIVDTSDEWIVSRTGMKERRLAGPSEYTSDMGYLAAEKAIEAAQINKNEIDFIIFATLTPDYMFPNTACLIQARLGIEKAGAVDIQAACTGYLYALSMAKSFIESGAYKNILVVASEKLSSIVDYTDRNTCVLFGDGASACIVAGQGNGLVVHDLCLGSDGQYADLLILPAGGSRNPASSETIAKKMHFVHMEGKEIFKHAVRRMASAATVVLHQAGLSQGDIRWLVPHQANIRIIEAIAKRFSYSTEQVFLTVEKYGNTSASSIGIALDELIREGGLKNQDHIMLVAFGAGLTWGAGVLTQESNL